jgi:integrase
MSRNRDEWVEEATVRALADIEKERILSAARSRPAPQRLTLRLLLEYGVTAHELCRLRTSDAAEKTISVRDKRASSRTIYLRDDAAADLAAIKHHGDATQLLAGRAGVLRPDTVRRLLIDAAREADFTDLPSIHQPRLPEDVRA